MTNPATQEVTVTGAQIKAVHEFLDYAGCFKNVSMESFRPNFDLAVLAEKV